MKVITYQDTDRDKVEEHHGEHLSSLIPDTFCSLEELPHVAKVPLANEPCLNKTIIHLEYESSFKCRFVA